MKTANFSRVEVMPHDYEVLLIFTLDNTEHHGIAIHRTETSREMLAEMLTELAETIRRGM